VRAQNTGRNSTRPPASICSKQCVGICTYTVARERRQTCLLRSVPQEYVFAYSLSNHPSIHADSAAIRLTLGKSCHMQGPRFFHLTNEDTRRGNF